MLVTLPAHEGITGAFGARDVQVVVRDAFGREQVIAVLPLASYVDNYVRFDRKAIPFDYAFRSSSSVNVSPAWRSGALIEFDIRQRRAVIGRLVDQRGAPIEYRSVTLTQPGVAVRAFTGQGGEFYAEEVAPGEWTISAPGCAAVLHVADEPVVELEAIVCR